MSVMAPADTPSPTDVMRSRTVVSKTATDATATLGSVLRRGLPWAGMLACAVLFLSADVTWRGPLLLGLAVALWAFNVLPDFAVGFGLVVGWNLLGVGRPETSLSGFSSPTWFLLIAILALAAGLVASGVLERIAIRLLLLFPATFTGQTVALLLGGLLITPALPLTVARSAMTAPLAGILARTLGYQPGSPPAVGIGLAAFVGAGLMSRGFLSGAALNFIAWGLLPPAARPSWLWWALAALPVTLVTAFGSLAIIVSAFRPTSDAPLPADLLKAQLRERGPLTRDEGLVAAASLAVFCGFIVAPPSINGAWLAGLGFLALLAFGILKRDQIRNGLDWPLLLFLGVTLSLPGMVHELGLDTRIVSLVVHLLPPAHCSPVWSLAALLLLTLGVRVVLSEWVAVPLLTVALLPAAPALDLHPWVIAFIVLLGSNMWTLPHQYASYVAFVAGSGGALWSHRQVWPFSLAYMGLILVGLMVSVPWWRLLGLAR